MGIKILPTSDQGKTIKNISDYLGGIGMTDEAENISQYLNDGNFLIGEWFIDLIGAGGFAPFPDTGSGAPIYINKRFFPPDGTEWKLDDPTSYDFKKAFKLLEILIHEKYHTEEQGWTERLWYLMEIPNFFLFWLDSYNPMETTAHKHTVTFFDNLIDIKIAQVRQIAQIPQLLAHHYVQLNKLMMEIEVAVDIKYSHMRSHNRKFRPDIPEDKLSSARNKIKALRLNLPPIVAPPVMHQQILEIQAELNIFEHEMANS